MPKNLQAAPSGSGKYQGGAPGQPDPQALMRLQQLQQMQTMGQMPQEANPVTPMPQVRGRVAPGQGMLPGQFQAPQGRIDPRAFAMQLAQMRAMRAPPGMGNNGIAQYQAAQAAKIQAQKDAMAAAAALKQKKVPVEPYTPPNTEHGYQSDISSAGG